MIPLNVTHQAIVTDAIHAQLLSPGASHSSGVHAKASSNLRHMLSTLISFFKESYKSTFGFNAGPPLHDALTIAYISCPEILRCTRYRVDVELAGSHSTGETIVDVWGYQMCDHSWGSAGKNCQVALDLDVSGIRHAFNSVRSILTKAAQVNVFFAMFLDCVTKCDEVSPLNR